MNVLDLVSNIDSVSCTGDLSPQTSQNWEELDRLSVNFPVLSNGSFHADMVEPGDYTLSGLIRRNGEMTANTVWRSINVRIPDDETDSADVPLDLGNLDLKPVVNLGPGDLAPDFAVESLRNKEFKLSDFRGKFVLLDFWATWCVPCVAEIPNLKEVYDGFGEDKRFVMIGLSLDKDRDAPLQFVESRKIHWMQAFLGEWSKEIVTQSYGIYAIPQICLIGPNGKLVARDLRGPKIKETLASALRSYRRGGEAQELPDRGR